MNQTDLIAIPHWHKFFDSVSRISVLLIGIVLPISTSLTNIFFILAATTLLLSGNGFKIRTYVFDHPVALMFIGFFVLYAIGITYTVASWSESLHIFMKFNKFLLGALLLWHFKDRTLAQLSLIGFLCSSFVVMALSFGKFFYLTYVGDYTLFERSVVFKDHISMNLLNAYAAFVVFSLGIVFKRSSLMVLAMVWVSHIWFISTGRTGYVVLLSLMAFMAIRLFSYKGIVFSLLAILGMLASAYHISDAFRARTNQAYQDIQTFENRPFTDVGVRLKHLLNGLQIITKSPFFGVGTGGVQMAYQQQESDTAFVTRNPHNEYLNMTIQFGVIGGLFLCMFYVLLWLVAERLTPLEGMLAKGLVLSISIHSLANCTLMNTTEGHFFIYIAAILFANIFNQSDSIVKKPIIQRA